MQFLNLLRADYWLDVHTPIPLSVPALAALSGAMLISLLWLWRARRMQRTWRACLMIAAGVALVASVGRASEVPLLSARLPWLLVGGVAALPLILPWASAARQCGAWQDAWRALTFAPMPPSSKIYSARFVSGWLALHGLGLLFVIVNARLPLWTMPVLGCALLCPAIIASVARTRGSAWRVLMGWAPLIWSWAVVALDALGAQPSGVLNGIVHPSLGLAVGVVWSLAASARLAAHALGANDNSFAQWGGLALLAATILWSLWTSSTLRTHGVTGSDPFAYVQMGIDLVRHGTVLHPFPLVEVTHALGIASYPVVHVGYRIPTHADTLAPSVWPPGFAVLTGLAYQLGGELGLYWLNPLLGVLAAIITALFALAFNRSVAALPVAALSALFTATSLQQVRWQMLPMADIAAQILTLLALITAWIARGRLHFAAASGLLLGAAFCVRYTQVLLAPAIAFALWAHHAATLTWRQRALSVTICAACAWLAAAPVLVYHTVVFGHPFVTGSDELMHFSLADAPETLGRAITALAHYREFGFLAPLIVWGVIAQWRDDAKAATTLLIAFGVLLGFHALYRYLRLRDVLFLFPFLSLWAAYGIGSLWRQLDHHRKRALALVFIFVVVHMVVLRTMETWALPITRGFDTFGYLLREQRESFNQLRALTPANALIGSTLNSGAVELYAQRLAFRPADWSAEELWQFVDAMRARGHVLYLLDDGEALTPSLAALRQRYKLQEVARLLLPRYHAVGGGSENAHVPLYSIGEP